MPRIRQIHFRPDKYGPELLVDTAPVSRLKGFVLTPESHTLSFYDILLITRGRGKFWLDDTCYPVKPGRVIFTSPGQVRRLEAQRLEGLVLFFTGAFSSRCWWDCGGGCWPGGSGRWRPRSGISGATARPCWEPGSTKS